MKITDSKQSHLFASIVKTTLKTAISLVAIAVQVVFYYFLFFGLYNLWYIQLFLGVMGVVIVFMLYRRNINSNFKLSWTIFILAVPFAGTIFYIIFGNDRAVPKRKANKIYSLMADKVPKNTNIEELSKLDLRAGMIATSLYKSTGLPLYKNTETRFFATAEEKHASLLLDLASAKESILIEYFIISDGLVLDGVLEVLERKGKEGVSIKLLFDDIGSKKALKRKTKKRIARIENLELCVFEPLGVVFNPRVNYRDHRKIVVIDYKIGYVGGDNLADEYINRLVKYGHWRDNAMRIEGDGAYSLALIFAETWFLSSSEKIELPEFVSQKRETAGYIMPFGDGPTNRNDPAYRLFEGLASASSKYLYISTPYFIIDNAFINLVCQASRSGVEVRILLPKIPDKKLIFAVTRGHYGELIKAGCKVYEYTPGFNHAKNIIVDDRYAFIGTVNCDYRSLMLHFENGLYLALDPEIEIMREDFLSACEESELITLEKWKKRPLRTKIAEVALSFIAPLL